MSILFAKLNIQTELLTVGLNIIKLIGENIDHVERSDCHPESQFLGLLQFKYCLVEDSPGSLWNP